MKSSLQNSKSIKLVLTLVLLFSIQAINAQPITISLSDSKSSTEVKQNDFSKSVFNFNFQSLNGLNVETEKGVFTELFLEKGHYVGEFGNPKLPASKHLIEIPFGAEVEVVLKNYNKTQIKLSDFGVTNQLMPAQPMLRKDQDVSEVPFEYKPESFEKSAFIDHPIATVDILGVMRGVRIAQLTVAPIRYNPVDGLLEVYNDLEIELVYRNSDIAKTLNVKASTFSPYFESIYGKLDSRLSTKDLFDDHPDLTKIPKRMVIVSNRMFEGTLQPFIEWKTQQGIYVTVGYTDVIGSTATAIQSYIHGIYNSATPENPAPTFIIMVGDPATMPASANGSATSSVTDLYYASVDGDMFPEMYYGRLSARNVQELQNQIDKILYYQKYEFDDPTYLNDVTLIAGSDGTWNPRIGQPTIKYGTANYFNAANGFNTVWGYGVANDPNNPNNSPGYTGCYDNQRISVSLINFTAHCSPTSWAGPTLSVSDVHNMTNTGKYPLAVGNCCQSSLFSNPESIGEAWVRAQNKGAVAYIGSAPNTHWFNDFYWAVGAFPIVGQNDGYVPTVAETSLGAYDAPFVSDYLSVAALKFVGNLAISQAAASGYPTHQSAIYYWQAYHTFGDPSTFIYLKEGLDNVVSHLPIVPIGINTYTVQALPGSYVAISKDGVLHGAALVDSTGEVEVPIDPILDGGDVMIVVTKPQHIPYIVEIPAAALEGPFIVIDNFSINDQDGNNNGLADYGETFSVHLTLKNVGADPGTNITATISGNDDYFSSSTTALVSFGNINAGDSGNTSTVNDAFSFTLANNVPDQHQATFLLNITDGSETWTANLRLRAYAPVLSIGSISIDDGGEGIPGVLDPGETANAVIQVSNIGSSEAQDISAILSTQSQFLTINGEVSTNLGPLAAGASTSATFSVTADADTPLETNVSVNLSLASGEYTAVKNLTIVVGYIPEYNMQNGQVTACIGRFYDSGGPTGDYSNSQNLTMTFFPANDEATLLFNFTAFNTENNYDKLFVYDGVNSSAPQFPGSPFMGTVSPGTIMATNEAGAITFNFISDGSVTRPGWEAEFFCVDLGVPPVCATNPNPAVGQVISISPVTLTWGFVPGAIEYDVFIGQGVLPTEPTTTVTTNSYVIDVQEYTNYVWKVVPKNGSGSAEGCAIWNFSTIDIAVNINMHSGTITTCNALFYDSGGPSGQYSNNENHTLTVYPVYPTGSVKITFSQFDLENNYDFLKIYNGTSATSPLLANLTGATLPGSYVANNSDGALTFVFTSDGSLTRAGWTAHLSCEMQTYQVTFTVTDPSGVPIEGARLAVAQEVVLTDSDGIAEVELPGNETYSWSITKTGYEAESGELVLEESPLSVAVILQQCYMVTFQVATSGGPLHQAEIKIGGHTIHTNNTGHAQLELVPGSYPYEVKYMDFPTITGTINIVDEHVFMGILLETSVSDLSLQEVKIFPNPFSGKIYLTGATGVNEVIITNLNGQEVTRVVNNNNDSIEIQTGSLTPGVYLVKLVSDNNAVFVHKMVKN